MERRKGVYKNHDFFKDRTVDSIYWAGFILGDGCIIEDKRSNSKTLSVHLAGVDSKHLDRMQESIGGLRRDYSRYDPRSMKKRDVSVINICSKEIVKDLEDIYGISPRKTLNEQPPTGLNRADSLIFIAGLIDADGSYYVNRGGRPGVSLVGSRSVLEWVNEILFDGKLKVRSMGNVYVMATAGDKAIEARAKLHRINGIPLLERKIDAWERAGAAMHLSGRRDNKIG